MATLTFRPVITFANNFFFYLYSLCFIIFRDVFGIVYLSWCEMCMVIEKNLILDGVITRDTMGLLF